MTNLENLFEAVYFAFEDSISLSSQGMTVKQFLIKLNETWKKLSSKRGFDPNYIMDYVKECKVNNIDKPPLLKLVKYIVDNCLYFHTKSSRNMRDELDYDDIINLAVNTFDAYKATLKEEIPFLLRHDSLYNMIIGVENRRNCQLNKINCYDILVKLKTMPWYVDLASVHVLAAKQAEFAAVDQFELLHPAVQQYINKHIGNMNLYKHQSQGLSCLLNKMNICVNTGTASGKSLIYILYSLSLLGFNFNRRIICVYPTKALTQNQLFTWTKILTKVRESYCGFNKVKINIIDGDSPVETRSNIVDSSSILLTNFDFLHKNIPLLMNSDFLLNLCFIVLDEAHVYKGVYGTDVAYTFRRLLTTQRFLFARNYKCKIDKDDTQVHQTQIITCTATLGNPKEHFIKLTGVNDVTVVSNDGSPQAEKHYVLWIPPLISNAVEVSTLRRSAMEEALNLFVFLIKQRVRTFLFCNARVVVEILFERAKKELAGEPELCNSIISYRAGYNQAVRRTLEAQLFNNEVMGVVCTNALELGIDIGVLDCVISLGFSGTISSIRQRLGRAGRSSNRPCLGFLVAYDNPVELCLLNQFGNTLWEKDAEPVGCCLDDAQIQKQHLYCMLSEIPCPINLKLLIDVFGDNIKEILDAGIKAHELHRYEGDFYKFIKTDLDSLFKHERESSMQQNVSSATSDASESRSVDVIKHLNDTVVSSGFNDQNLIDLLEYSDPRLQNNNIVSNSAFSSMSIADVFTSRKVTFLVKNPASVINIRTSSMPKVEIFVAHVIRNVEDSKAGNNAKNIEENYNVLVNSKDFVKIDEVDLPLSFLTCFPGAVYMHFGKKYLIKQFVPKMLICTLEVPRTTLQYYTKPSDRTNYYVVKPKFQCLLKMNMKVLGRCVLGSVKSVLSVPYYREIYPNGKIVKVPLNIPSFEHLAYSLRISFDEKLVSKWLVSYLCGNTAPFIKAMHGLIHMLIKILETKSWCSSGDLVGNCSNFVWNQTVSLSAAIYIMEQSQSLSNGVLNSIFVKMSDIKREQIDAGNNIKTELNIEHKEYFAQELLVGILKEARNMFNNCECVSKGEDGCLFCVTSFACSDRNAYISAESTKTFLDYLLSE